MSLDRTALSILADFFINLAAGWLGIVIILSPKGRKTARWNLIVLTADVAAGIVCLIIAYNLRKISII